MTHQDYVEACRLRLYVMANRDPITDATPEEGMQNMYSSICEYSCTNDYDMLHLYTYYNCTPFQDISATRSENIFSQASMEREVFKLAIKFMALYKEGKLKDQKKIGKGEFYMRENDSYYFKCRTIIHQVRNPLSANSTI
jgi:hypothetical protein